MSDPIINDVWIHSLNHIPIYRLLNLRDSGIMLNIPVSLQISSKFRYCVSWKFWFQFIMTLWIQIQLPSRYFCTYVPIVSARSYGRLLLTAAYNNIQRFYTILLTFIASLLLNLQMASFHLLEYRLSADIRQRVDKINLLKYT